MIFALLFMSKVIFYAENEEFFDEAQRQMENDPDLWIGMLTNDIFHWAEYGVHTVADLEKYLDAEAEGKY